MNKQFAIFIDIDGTLYSDSGIPQENIDVIREVREANHYVFVNTGRSYAHIPDVVFDTVPLDGAVSALGAYARFRDSVLHNSHLSHDQLRMVSEHFLSEGRTCFMEGDEKVFVIHPRHDSSMIPINSSDDFDRLYPDSNVHIFLTRGKMTDRERELFQDEFLCIEHETYYECALKGNSKSRGMEIIVDHLGLPIENCIAIGDSLNDMDMMKHAGFSIAMDNALDEVKKASDFVTKSVDEAGVAFALRKYVLKNL
jgi:Cof subfamily protein (haloacid dehalogenase superfamily)